MRTGGQLGEITFIFIFQVFLGFPIFFLIICIFLMIMPLTTSPMECFMGIIMVLTGIPVYIIGVVWQTKPNWIVEFLGKCSVFLILKGRIEGE